MNPSVALWAWVVMGAGCPPTVMAVASSPEAALREAVAHARQAYTTPEDVGYTLEEVLADVEAGALVCLTAPSQIIAEACAERLLIL